MSYFNTSLPRSDTFISKNAKSGISTYMQEGLQMLYYVSKICEAATEVS